MQQLQFGNTTIDRVAEIDQLWVDPAWLYPNVQDEMVQRHKKELGPNLVHAETSKLCLSFHSYVVRTRGKTILVDTCNGNHKPRQPKMPWQHMLKSHEYLTNLAKIGLRPEDIDIVLCTHLHTDHVGWNTQLVDGRWVPTFPNARYIMARQEFDHYMNLHAQKPDYPVGHGSFADSVLPVVEAGQADFVDMNHVVEGSLDDGVWMEAANGHTPGHVTIHVKGAGQDAIMSGDIVHHPILFLEPSLVNLGDWNPEMANQTRRKLFERCADTSTLLLTMHFPSPTAGRLTSCSHGFRFHFLER